MCIAGSDQATPEVECQHTLDEMGCGFVMAQVTINNGTFESCESDAAYPPGLYPQPDGSTSTFQQYYSGVYTVGATAYSYQNAQSNQVTPSSAYSYPTPSSCSTVSSIANGLKGLDYVAKASSGGASSAASHGPSGSTTSDGGSGANSGAASKSSGAMGSSSYVATTGLIGSVVALLVGMIVA